MVEVPGDAFRDRPDLDMLDEEGTYRCGFCPYTKLFLLEGDPPCKKCLLPSLVKSLESIARSHEKWVDFMLSPTPVRPEE